MRSGFKKRGANHVFADPLSPRTVSKSTEILPSTPHGQQLGQDRLDTGATQGRLFEDLFLGGGESIGSQRLGHGSAIRYASSSRRIDRIVSAPTEYRSSVGLGTKSPGHDTDYDWHWLRAKQWPKIANVRGSIAVADLFCGSGGLSLGAWEAARAVQLEMKSVFAIDNDIDAVASYVENFAPGQSACSTIETLVDGRLGAKATTSERSLKRGLGNIDVLVAGPPCQGHSDLNNHTRRDDPRNVLLLRVIRFAELFSPRHILIENVQGIRRDRFGIFDKAEDYLCSLGYSTASFLLEGHEVGVPQKRRRCFLLASRTASLDQKRLLVFTAAQSVRSTGLVRIWNGLIWMASLIARQRSILRTKSAWNILLRMIFMICLDSERPDCHRLKEHDYRSVYGRLRADQPAPTITTGFGSPGQGRFTHPRFY